MRSARRRRPVPAPPLIATSATARTPSPSAAAGARSGSAKGALAAGRGPVAPPYEAIHGHTLVFVGGLPQSGTSFLRQLVVGNGNIASGQDACRRTTRCEMSNIEGQWLLDDEHGAGEQGRLRAAYGPGDELNCRTEQGLVVVEGVAAPATAQAPLVMRKRRTGSNYHPGKSSPLVTTDEMRRFLWRGWGRYWDLSRPFLVEKSPPNLLKTRWLAQVFASSGSSGSFGGLGGGSGHGAGFGGVRQTRFLIVVKAPVTNSHFAGPRRCPDVESPAFNPPPGAGVEEDCNPLLHGLDLGGGGGGGASSTTASSESAKARRAALTRVAASRGCHATHDLCGRPRNLLVARMAYLEHWLLAHEAFLEHSTRPVAIGAASDNHEFTYDDETNLLYNDDGPRKALRDAAGARRTVVANLSAHLATVSAAEAEAKKNKNNKNNDNDKNDDNDKNSNAPTHGRRAASKQHQTRTGGGGRSGGKRQWRASEAASRRYVRVLRYEQIGEKQPCICEKLVRFTFSDASTGRCSWRRTSWPVSAATRPPAGASSRIRWRRERRSGCPNPTWRWRMRQRMRRRPRA